MDTAFDRLAQDYVWLGLQHHNHDPNRYTYMRAQARRSVMPIAELDHALSTLAERLAGLSTNETPGGAPRHAALTDRVAAIRMRLNILQGQYPASFDDEARTMFSIDAPRRNEAYFRAIAEDLAQVVPGTGPLPERVIAFRDRFLVAPDRLEAAVTEALRETRRRTRAHMTLPDDERVTVQMDTEGLFPAFADHLGKGHTVVHFSKKLAFHADRVVELAAHEAYPGHHVQGTLFEAELVDRRGWAEWTMYPLFGAHAVLCEGAANYGVRLSFDRQERITYERETILPIAGLSHLAGELDAFHHYVDLVEQLNFARNEAARRYLYEGWDRERAISWLMEFGLETRGTAEPRFAVFDALRCYTVAYNYGLDWVTAQIEGDGPLDIAGKWARLRSLLETPILPLQTSDGRCS